MMPFDTDWGSGDDISKDDMLKLIPIFVLIGMYVVPAAVVLFWLFVHTPISSSVLWAVIGILWKNRKEEPDGDHAV